MRKTLVLKREPLAELTGDELSGVVGGSTVLTPAVITAMVRDALSSLRPCA